MAITGAGGKKNCKIDVDELLHNLNLSKAEKGLVLAKEDRGTLLEVKWMAAAKLLMVKEFNEISLMSTMRVAWSMMHEVTFRPIGKNLFITQAFCLGIGNG